MKTFLQLVFCFFLACISENIIAQVTKLSNNTNFDNCITLGNKAFLKTDKDSIWVTDGTAGGTKLFVNNVSSTDEAVVYKNKIYFGGINVSKGTELWVSDGTPNGTKIFKDINSGSASSTPNDFFVYNNTLYFFATTAASGNELWKTDGTTAGTVMVKDIWKGKGSSNDPNSPSFFYPVHGKLFFEANDSTHGNELWVTDGTSGGTNIVKDLNPGKPSFTFTTYSDLNNQFVFSGKDNTPLGIKLYKTDGTSGGTVLIKTLLSSSNTSSVNALDLSKYKSTLIFELTGLIISIPNFTIVNQLYSTDGTSGGTALIKDFGAENIGFSFGTLTPQLNKKFYFTSFSDTSNKLWQSNGTTAGTTVTKKFSNGVNLDSGYIPVIITDFFVTNRDSIGTTDFNGQFFIAADDSTHGYEPWITDGTPKGTKMVKDIYKNASSSLSLDNFTFIYSKQGFYFAAKDKSTGNELWFSDGTGAGTTQVADINVGKKGSNPVIAGILNNHLLINADDGDNNKGRTDLYKVNKTFDTLTLAKTADAVKVNIAPDGTSFSVYPNPARDQLNVVLNKNLNSQHVSFVITDQKGRQLYANEISGMQASSNYKIDISRFALGTYYLEVRTDKGVVSTEFVKIK